MNSKANTKPTASRSQPNKGSTKKNSLPDEVLAEAMHIPNPEEPVKPASGNGKKNAPTQ